MKPHQLRLVSRRETLSEMIAVLEVRLATARWLGCTDADVKALTDTIKRLRKELDRS